jgi:hypothetical protein
MEIKKTIQVSTHISIFAVGQAKTGAEHTNIQSKMKQKQHIFAQVGTC